MFCIHCRSEIDSKFKACPFCGEAITDFLRRYAEHPIDGKYQLLSRLGVGGMGEVYKALHVHLNAIRVIKVMRSQLEEEEGAHDRFLREARLATRIQHPNVAALFDFSTLDDGSRYMVWEYIEGINLHEMLKERGPLSPHYAATIAVQALMGLEAIHRAGIIHRDISPENIMVAHDAAGEERVKIIDLGIAKAGVETDDAKTKTGMFVGKWKYCSPEHLGMLPDGEKIDFRADLYSFGIVLYEMLTGVPPFQADTPHSYLMMHASERPKALREVNPSIPAAPEFEALIFRALEKERKNRYASAREFAKAIEEIRPALTDTAAVSPRLPKLSDTTVDATRAADVATVVNVPDAAATVLETEQPRKRRGLFVAAAVAGVAIAIPFIPRGGGGQPPAAVQRPVVVKQSVVTPQPPSITVAVVSEKRGHIGINAYPWAEVTRVVNAKSGEEVDLGAPLVTPAPLELPEGKYELTLSNPSLGKSVKRTITVTAGKEQVLNVTFRDAASASLPAFGEGAK